MEPEVIGTIGVLANKSRTAILKILGFQGNRINIVGECYSGEGTIQQYSTVCVTSSRLSTPYEYDSLVDKGYTYYAEVVVPAPGRYQIINQTYEVDRVSYSSIPTERNPLPIGTSTVSGISWNYKGEIVDVQICTYNVIDARANISRWAGIKAIVNSHREKELLHLGQIIDAPSGLNSVTGGSAQFAVFSIDDVPGYPHAVIFGPVQPLIGPRMMSNSKIRNNDHGYYNTELSIYLDTTYFSSLPTELQQVISPRQATYTPGRNIKSYYPETHRVWLPRISELTMPSNVTGSAASTEVSSGELTTSSYYLELDGRIFGLSKYCEFHPKGSSMLNDDAAGCRIYYNYAIWTASVNMGPNFACITPGGRVQYQAPNSNTITTLKAPLYAAPFFMITADDDSCEYHYLRMLT